ncbi:hypothetical protein [Mycoplasmopsis synoviae]|uniref:hypothetical protein n=1 Tax=Mycoplasmopsis synoviae TaxID=2109 RepID=UPI00349EDE67
MPKIKFLLQNFNFSLRKMAKDLGISHVSLIKEIKKTQVNMDMMPSLLENHDIKIRKKPL